MHAQTIYLFIKTKKKKEKPEKPLSHYEKIMT